MLSNATANFMPSMNSFGSVNSMNNNNNVKGFSTLNSGMMMMPEA